MCRIAIMEPSHENTAQNSIGEPTVQAASVGDRRALHDIYEATSDRVYRLMVRMVGIQDADDLTQQVYVRAFSKLSQFSGDSKFETWLYRLATNEALQHLRREKHRRTKELIVEPAMGATDQVEQDERVEMVRHALDQLGRSSRSKKKAVCRTKRSPRPSTSPKVRLGRGLLGRGGNCDGWSKIVGSSECLTPRYFNRGSRLSDPIERWYRPVSRRCGRVGSRTSTARGRFRSA